MLNSTTKVDDLVQTAKERGYASVALTDENVLYGVVDFYNAARKAGIHPIIGMTLSVMNDTDQSEEPIVMLAKNQNGYRNLAKLSTLRNTGEQRSIDFEQAKNYLQDLFIIHPVNGEAYKLVFQGDIKKAVDLVKMWQQSSDPDSTFIGINPQVDAVKRQSIEQLSEQTNVEKIALNRAGYLNADDHFSVEVLRSIDQGSKFQDPESLASQLGDHFLRPMAEEADSYEKIQLSKAVYQTVKVAEICQVDFQFQAPVLPHFPAQGDKTSQQFLRELCIDGLKKRTIAPGFNVSDYSRRLAKELQVIHEMGFDDYFLIIWDVMHFAHQAQIMTGPGRGSAAGSLVAYALAITDVDPLRYHLLFERFLNPQRAQMPDIDLDLPDSRRGEVLQYVHDKYGHQKVAQIITFGTLAAKQVLRDVGRVFGLSKSELSAWSDAIPDQLHISLDNALNDSLKLRNLVGESSKNQLLFKVARRLEGLPRHYSTHAAGIVLSDEPLINIVPLQDGSDGLLMTQFTKDTVESLGLLKMDFLGLRNLTIMAQTVGTIQRTKPDFNLSQIRLDDQQTLQLFQQGNTNGVFQFESAGIKNVLVQLHPDNFELIVAVNALYRPGPMDNIDTFIKRKKGQEPVMYPDDSLKSILEPTYGILVYQEQVLQAASEMAGFSLGEADLLRRAMSKKKTQVMNRTESDFISGAKKMGHDATVAKQVFNYIEQFAHYGFNRSHAVAYSKMAFEMAYLKVHYPEAFFAALMNSVSNNPTKIKDYLLEVKKHGVKILTPNINYSDRLFTVQDNKIIFGLSSIKGLRNNFIDAIIDNRNSNGNYQGLLEFIQRLDSNFRRVDLIQPLIYSGAFDGLGYNRAELTDALPGLLDSVELTGSSLSLFEDLKPTIKERPEFSLTQRLEFEEQYVGAYLSGHPVDQFGSLSEAMTITPIAKLQADRSVTVLLFVSHVKTIRTKRGDQMAFVSGSDQSGSIDVTIFPNTYKRVQSLLEEENILLINGKTEINRGLQIVADTVRDARDVSKNNVRSSNDQLKTKRWVLRIDRDHQTQDVEDKLRLFCKQHRGTIPVILFNPVTDQKVIQPKDQWLTDDSNLAAQLTKIIGSNNVVLQKINSQN